AWLRERAPAWSVGALMRLVQTLSESLARTRDAAQFQVQTEVALLTACDVDSPAPVRAAPAQPGAVTPAQPGAVTPARRAAAQPVATAPVPSAAGQPIATSPASIAPAQP